MNTSKAFKKESTENFDFLLKNYIELIDNKENTLVNLASPLLNLIIKNKATKNYPNPELFLSYIKDELQILKYYPIKYQDFIESWENYHFILCDFIDELIKQLTWISKSLRQNNTMVSIFYADKKIKPNLFLITNNSITNIDLYCEMLEFIYFCLRMGYKGEYNNFSYLEIIENHKRVYNLLFDIKYSTHKNKNRSKLSKKFFYIRIFYNLYKLSKNKVLFKDSKDSSLNTPTVVFIILLLIFLIYYLSIILAKFVVFIFSDWF